MPPAAQVAPQLLNKLLVTKDGRIGRILETEAYGGSDDPASHAFGGPTPRNLVMFGPPGGLYVYRSYGIHWCANAVCGPTGTATAVLIRALEPLVGLGAMRQARQREGRPAVDRDLCRGPGRLCQALGINGVHNGVDMCGPNPSVWVADDDVAPPAEVVATPRIGISRGVDTPWRFAVPGHRGVSAFSRKAAGSAPSPPAQRRR